MPNLFFWNFDAHKKEGENALQERNYEKAYETFKLITDEAESYFRQTGVREELISPYLYCVQKKAEAKFSQNPDDEKKCA